MPENIPFGKPEQSSASHRFFPKKFVANLESALFSSRVRAARFFKYWLPVLLWMIVIFGASTNLGAPRNTSRIIGPVLRWLVPDISDDAVARTQFFVRKSCHAIEYGILALLFWRARRKRNRNGRAVWSWREAGVAILFCAIYASTDEFHQYFVATRQGSPWDVLLDSAGAGAGILGLWKIGCWLKRWD